MSAVTFGKTPRDNIGRGIPLKDLQDVRKSGFYNLVVSSASIKKGVSQKGKPWEQLNIGMAVLRNSEPIARLYANEFISSNSQRLQDLCYFAGLRDAEGNIYCPEAREFTYTDKNTGEQKTASSIDEFQGIEIWAVVQYKGERALNNGSTVPEYQINICNRYGQTATEEALKVHPVMLKPMFDALKVELPPLSAEQMQMNANAPTINAQPAAKPQQEPQQSPAPQQHIYAPQPGERVLVPQQVPQQNPAPQPYAQQMMQNSMDQMFGGQAQKINPDTINDNDLPF